MKPDASTVQLPVVGIRPVAGAIGACALMLLACSWFSLAKEHAGPGVDVGTPAPVRFDDNPRDVGVQLRSVSTNPPQIVHARAVPPAARRQPSAPVVYPSPARDSEPQAPIPAPASTSAAESSPAAQSAPAPTTTPAPSLPAAPVAPPAVVVPSITVSVPPVANVPLPAVTVSTPRLELP